jgi:hypothetical protein
MPFEKNHGSAPSFPSTAFLLQQKVEEGKLVMCPHSKFGKKKQGVDREHIPSGIIVKNKFPFFKVKK